MFTIAVRLSGTPEVWRELRFGGQDLRFEHEQHAKDWLKGHYPHTIRDNHVRPDMFHGIQPLRIVEV